MSSDAASAPRPRLEADLGGSDYRPPPEIRVDDEDGAAKLTLPGAGGDVWTGDVRRRSMPSNHGRFVDEPYVFSLSQALALSGRRRSEPFMDASAEPRETSSGSSASSHRHVFIDQLASSGKLASAVVAGDRRSSVGAIPKTTTTTTTTTTSPDELSGLQLAAGASADSSIYADDEQTMTPPAGSRFLSLPQTSDYLSVPARRHSVALLQPATSRMLDVIAEEQVATDSKNLASSRRYSLSCHLNA